MFLQTVQYKKCWILTRRCEAEKDLVEVFNSFDLLISGSDQIWNPNWYHRFYYADYEGVTTRRISYAPSMGVTKILDEVEPEIKRSVSKFDAISVREENAVSLLEPYSKYKPVVAVDPTLLLDSNDWASILPPTGAAPKSDYVLGFFIEGNFDHLERNKMAKYFETDGFRGEAGITLTADHAYKVGRFLGWYYNALRERNGDTDPARIVIGKDTRRSSYMFEYSLVAGLTASGADAYLLHVTTTPSVAYIARVDDFDCGIMISASHNPYYDNGIKLIDCYGEKMPEETLLLVEDYIDGKLQVFDQDWPELPFAHREHIGCTVDYVAGRNRYMGYLISLGIYSFKGIKVGLDCANGSSWNIAKSVFDALGADTYVINNQPNGLNINNNAGSTHIEGLQKFVVEKGLDVGFAYDGDADRCLCVDEKGNVITGDHILYIYGCYMKERGKLLTNTVVTTVMSNFGLYKAFDEQGIGYAKTAVGDKYVYEYMAKNGCRIGGEQSGHIIFSKYASTGDGILTSLKMMEVMLAKKKPMSELAAALKIYPQVLENVRVTDKKAAQSDEAVQTAVKKVAEGLGDTGRILVRESGTEPVVRVMVEAPDHDTCQKYVSEVVDVIRDRGYSL